MMIKNVITGISEDKYLQVVLDLVYEFGVRLELLRRERISDGTLTLFYEFESDVWMKQGKV